MLIFRKLRLLAQKITVFSAPEYHFWLILLQHKLTQYSKIFITGLSAIS